MKKIFTIIAGVIVVAAVVGSYFYPRNSSSSTVINRYVGTVGSVGDTSALQRVAQTQVAPAAGTYDTGSNKYILTSSSSPILNTDSRDRIILSIDYVARGLATVSTSTVSGGGAAVYQILAATSSSASSLNGNTNYVLNTTIATSSETLQVSTTTPGNLGTGALRIWATGSYIAIQSNATTAGPMWVKVNYLPE